MLSTCLGFELRIKHKLLTLASCVLYDMTPTYLSDLISYYISSCTLGCLPVIIHNNFFPSLWTLHILILLPENNFHNFFFFLHFMYQTPYLLLRKFSPEDLIQVCWHCLLSYSFIALFSFGSQLTTVRKEIILFVIFCLMSLFLARQ